MKALISFILGTWMLAMCAGVQAQTRSVSSIDPAFSRAELDQMLAPIALYPDTVLSHILIAATYPLEVVEAERWTRRNRSLEAEEAVNAAALEGWDPSVAALVAFPDILARMSDDLDWTQDLGDAFLADEGRVMDAIQNLREKAYASGHLKKMKHVKVQRESRIIVIEPAVERVVYVPYYDTRVVYGSWWWDRYPPVYWHAPTTYVHVGGFYWGPRIYVGSTFFFSSVHWPQRRVVVIDYHRHDHHHPRFYSGRKIAHYHGARHWEHNPVHRRNIVYRSEPVRQRYASHDGSRRFSREWREDKRGDGHREHSYRDQNQRDQSQRDNKFRNDGPRQNAREATTANTDSKRAFRNEAEQRHSSHRERPVDNKDSERRNPGLPREVAGERDKRAEQVRERLANNRAEAGGSRPGGASVRTGEPQRAASAPATQRQNEWRNQENTAVRQESQRLRESVDMEARREQLRRTQPQANDRDWRAERREQAQSQQDARREWQQRRAEPVPPRQERSQPQRAPQQEQRRFEPPRGQREGGDSRQGEREQRRFER